ncbi:MAG TPA: hypothetical protein VIK20_05795 [Bacteroidales bacterium]
MSIRKTFLSALSLFLFLSCMSAQNTSSPYSRYGLGSLENASMGKSRAMGGIGYGIRDNIQINPLNPASYSAVDTLNFVFDFGVSSSYSFFTENGKSQVNPNGKFDYLAMKVPLKKYWGLTMGLMPFSSVGYSRKENGTTAFGDIDYTNTYVGSGGLNTVFLGTGISLGKNLSLGTNIKYVFGTLSYTGTTSNTGYNSSYFYKSVILGTPSLDFGVQYQTYLGKKGKLVLGATFTNASAFQLNERDSINISGTDTTTSKVDYAFDLPNTIGIGASYTYDRRLTVGFDFQNQAWSNANFYGKKGTLSDNTRYALGVEYLPALIASNYLNAIRYRFGMNYTDTYYKFSDGTVKNAGITLGFGLPLRGQKSALNFSFEAGKLIVPASCALHENYFKVSLDVSFNEMWFLKRKL